MNFPTLEKPITINLGDGIERELCYNIRALRRMKERFGRAMVGLNEKGQVGVMGMDESNLPEILYEGLHDEDGNPPEGVTVDTLLKLPASAYPYMLTMFSAAYQQQTPKTRGEKKTDGESETATSQ